MKHWHNLWPVVAVKMKGEIPHKRKVKALGWPSALYFIKAKDWILRECILKEKGRLVVGDEPLLLAGIWIPANKKAKAIWDELNKECNDDNT